MPNNEEMDIMPIWQNHEQRITALEVTMSGLANKMDRVETKMDGVEKVIIEGNEEQRKKLETIDQRLLDEFFYKRRSNQDNKWKILGKILGAGGILYLLFDLVISKYL